MTEKIEEKITFDQVKLQGIKTAKIIITKIVDKNNVFLETEEDKEKKQIGENIDIISLYGVRVTPPEGPFFIAIIEEGILSIYEEVLYRISEEKDHVRHMKIYIPIW